MTTNPPRDDWDDARLNAAFAARALQAPATPSDVANDVVSRLRPIDRGLQRRPWFVMATAAVALVVVLGASSLLDRMQQGLSSSSAFGSAEPSSATRPTNGVLEALGEPITVSQAVAVLDSDQPDREIVVTGYLSVPEFRTTCIVVPETSENPTLLRCNETQQWVMEHPEQLLSLEGTSATPRSPSGPAFHPSFALVEPPTVPLPEDLSTPIPVVLIGHFHDRRAELCERGSRQGCERTFVVDGVASANGVHRAVGTKRLTLATSLDFEADVDALIAAVAPDAIVVGRQLMPVREVFAYEPILKDDQLVPYVDQSKLLWLVTAVEFGEGLPIARTFALLDGSNWFAEVTADGARPLERSAPAPSSGPRPVPPSGDPSAFEGAPRSIVGVPVHGVAEVMRLRRLGGSVHDEWAIAGWYLAPRPGVACGSPTPSSLPLAPPCDEARHWLLHDPQQFGVEPGQLRPDPEEFPSVLNPIVPSDVPFDVGVTWRGDDPLPAPVILLGHFGGVQAFHGGAYFVVDAVAWTRDQGAPSLDRITRLTTSATEDPRAVLERVAAVMPHPALATWTTVIDAEDLQAADPLAASEIAEFTSGPPVWIVTRLVVSDDAANTGVEREFGYTADHGTRVWTDTTDTDLDLATILVLRNLDSHTKTVRVFDYGQVIESIGPLSGLGELEWHTVGDERIPAAVARGRSVREVAIRWSGGVCGASWRLNVRSGNGSVDIEPFGSTCDGDNLVRQLLITFSEPVDIDRIRVGSNCCG